MRRILVCGGRDYADYYHLEEILSNEISWPEVIISGAASGADRMAVQWAVTHGIEFEEYPAQWDLYQNKDGPIRNQQMLDTGIDLVIAFPGGVGTADMVRRAKKAGVKVIEID